MHRPDQTSRGNPIEEPRQRLTRQEFAGIEAVSGPYSEFLGTEREHAVASADCDGKARLWAHPSMATVGTTLRLVLDRARSQGAGNVEATILVPEDTTAGWWSMTKHFAVVGSLESGGQIEENRLGSWVATTRKRRVLILRYPRTAGGDGTRTADGRTGSRQTLKRARRRRSRRSLGSWRKGCRASREPVMKNHTRARCWPRSKRI